MSPFPHEDVFTVAIYFEGYDIEPCPRLSAQGWLVRAFISGTEGEVICEDGNECPTYEEAAEASSTWDAAGFGGTASRA